MNIFTEKMKSKSTNELVEILNKKESFQKDAIIAVVEELKRRNYKEQELTEETVGIQLNETPESLFDKLKPHGYEVEKFQKNLIVLKRKFLFGMEVFRFERDKIFVGKKSIFKTDIVEYNRTEIKDIVIDYIAGYDSVTESFLHESILSISLVTLDGVFVKTIKVHTLSEYVSEIEELFEKIIEILRMKN